MALSFCQILFSSHFLAKDSLSTIFLLLHLYPLGHCHEHRANPNLYSLDKSNIIDHRQAITMASPAPLKYYPCLITGWAPVVINNSKEASRRGLHNSILEATERCIEILAGNITNGNLGHRFQPEHLVNAALDFTGCAQELLRRNATFSYQNASHQVIYTIAGHSGSRVLTDRLWDEEGVQPITNIINHIPGQHHVPIIPTHRSPLKGDTKPLTPATTPATSPIATPVVEATITVRQLNMPRKNPFLNIVWPKEARVPVWPPPAPHPYTLPIPSWYRKELA